MSTQRTIAVINQKGGSGKTTSAVNLAAALAEQGHSVLLVDLDGQCSATRYLGTTPGPLDALSVLLREAEIDQALTSCAVPNLDVLAATHELYGLERHLAGKPGAELRLRTALAAATPHDFVIIDCAPALGLLSSSALAAATEVLVPVTTGSMELEAVAEIRNTVAEVAEALNPGIAIRHVLACRADTRRRLDIDVIASLRAAFPDQMLTTVITERVRIRESYSNRQPITLFEPTGEAATQYRAAATEIIARRPTP